MSYTVIVEVAPIPTGGGVPAYVDVSDFALNETTINYGRETIDQQVDPSTCSITFLLSSALGEFDFAAFDLGYVVRVRALIDGYAAQRIRFLGVVTDMMIDRETMTITAVSQLISRYGKYSLPVAIPNINTAGVICAAIATAADPTIPNFVGAGPMANYWATGTFLLDADFAAGTNALEALLTTAMSEPYGFIYEDFAAEGMRSNDQNSRTQANPDITLTGTEIMNDWEVSKSVTSQLNKVFVNYVGGQTTYEVPSSLGELEKTYDTIIVSLADADEYAKMNGARGLNLRYEIPKATIPFATLSSARQNELTSNVNPYGIRINSFVRLPAIRPYVQRDYFVEGWSETISKHRWDWTLHLSDIGRSRYFQRWNQLNDKPPLPILTWDDLQATQTWADLYYDWI